MLSLTNQKTVKDIIEIYFSFLEQYKFALLIKEERDNKQEYLAQETFQSSRARDGDDDVDVVPHDYDSS